MNRTLFHKWFKETLRDYVPRGRKMRIRLILLTVLLAMPMLVCSVGAAEWVEVARFTEQRTKQHTTDYFTCDHVDWRIRWEYTPPQRYNIPATVYFVADIYERNQIVDTITGGGEVEVTLYCGGSVVSNGKTYHVITVDGNITNLAEFPIYNIKLQLELKPDDRSWFSKFEYLNIDTMSPNSTRQISETYFYEVDSGFSASRYDHSTEFDSYSIAWDQSDDPNGIYDIYGRAGTFYMEVDTNAVEFTIIVEQNVNSIPEEFTAFAVVVALIAVSILIRTAKHKKNYGTSETVSLASH